MANPGKLTREWVENQIMTEEYITRGERFMVCIIYTKGGYYVTGESAPINPAEFTEELGQKYSREEAVDKIWRIEGIIARKEHYGEGALQITSPRTVDVVEKGLNFFLRGDVVQLKSGSPEITVTSVDGDFVNGEWAGEDTTCTGTFAHHVLKFVDKELTE